MLMPPLTYIHASEAARTTAGGRGVGGGKCPNGMCPAAWYSMREFVESLAKGEGNFYDGWMKNPMSAMISCNDGFRPFSFYIEVTE